MPVIPENRWDFEHFRRHLQMAALLKAWTIPYYMAAMFSIVDRATPAYQLIQSVLHQEMLHLQLVANIANAYDYSPNLDPAWFSYGPDEQIPYLHVDFTPHSYVATVSNVTPDEYQPRSAAIGQLDKCRVNTMCLIEYPDWSTGSKPAYRDDLMSTTASASSTTSSNTARSGWGHRTSSGAGDRVDMFSAFYRRLPRVTVDWSGAEGLAQVLMMLDVIRDQGEAAKVNSPIQRPHENTADDRHPECSHYNKFCQIRAQPLPEIYANTVPVKEPAAYGPDEPRLEQILIGNFEKFIDALNGLFAGNNPDDFVPLMAMIGANMLTCWRNGVTPKFTAAMHLRTRSIAQPQRKLYAL